MTDPRPGSAAAFSEHEVDTAQRSRPDLEEGTKRTARMPRFELDAILKTKSGTRPVATSDEIDAHVRAQLAPLEAAEPEDPHSRPTIAESLFISTSEAARKSVVPLPAPRPRSWLAAAFFFVALASGAIGFVLGRFGHH